jgi:tetratricopeptide (TPR) repeat protein
MKLAHIASTTGASFLLAGGAAAMVIFCDGVDLRLVTTAYQQPVQMEYHHAVAAAAAEASQMTQEARQLIGTGTVKKQLPPSQGGVRGGQAPVQDKANQSVQICNRGLLQMQAGKLDDAVESFEKAMKVNPADPRAPMLRGVASARRGKHEEALRFYEQALSIDPASVEAYQSRGISLMKLNRLPLALEDFNKVLSLNPKFEEGYVKRGLVHGRLGAFKESIEDNTKAIALNPTNHLTYNNRAAGFTALGQREEAAKDLIASQQLEKAAKEKSKAKK